MSTDGYDLNGEEPVSPIIKDKFGNIVDGFHRKDVDEFWPEWTNEAIDTPLKLSYARLAANINRRTVDAQEIAERLEDYYEEYKKENGEYPKAEEVGARFGRTGAWVLKYLPQKFKSPEKVEAGQKSGEARSVQQERTQLAPFTPEELKIFQRHGLKPIDRKDGSRVWSTHSGVMTDGTVKSDRNYVAAMRELSPSGYNSAPKELSPQGDNEQKPEYSGRSARMSELTVKSDTRAENSLQTLLAPYSVELNARFGQDNNIRVEDKVYHPDAVLDDWLILEVEGEGSASADNPEREEALMRLGKRLVHIPNRVIRDPDMREVLRQLVVIATEGRPEVVA